eukprot:6957892-Karenia_brevis.AAC.1
MDTLFLTSATDFSIAQMRPAMRPGVADQGQHDACNSICHSSYWRVNAAKKWEKKGFKCFIKAPKSTPLRWHWKH